MQNNMPTKEYYTSLTEGAMIAAIAVVMGVMTFYLPIIGIAVAFLWSLPFSVAVVRRGIRCGILSLISAGLLMAMLVEPFLAARMVISFGILGLMLGFGYRRNWSGTRIFCSGLLTALLGEALSFGLLFLLMGINPLNMTLDACTETFNSVFKFYEEMGMFTENLATKKK